MTSCIREAQSHIILTTHFQVGHMLLIALIFCTAPNKKACYYSVNTLRGETLNYRSRSVARGLLHEDCILKQVILKHFVMLSGEFYLGVHLL